ncbi:hypothetical protein AVEN_189351-1 [Araneus ventricosus]|uniref:Uncharacterized protein n=1 Tax=Araneus ventricosus TaxID=182803 RepID=A0A4Y2JXP1_ARAVE|nr:hypothetical protein AVEN_189351-1 [Araneus ventricosus]
MIQQQKNVELQLIQVSISRGKHHPNGRKKGHRRDFVSAGQKGSGDFVADFRLRDQRFAGSILDPSCIWARRMLYPLRVKRLPSGMVRKFGETGLTKM